MAERAGNKQRKLAVRYGRESIRQRGKDPASHGRGFHESPLGTLQSEHTAATPEALLGSAQPLLEFLLEFHS